MAFEATPGLLETREAHGETTLVVDPARLVEACDHLRTAEGFNVLVDLCATDYLGFGAKGVAGYMGTIDGRDLNGPGSQGYGRVPDARGKRFTVNYHLLKLDDQPARVRVQISLDEGDIVDSVIGIWPSADWNERETFDLMGVSFRGHPNLTRILMPEDWVGHPLRKDYPIGGEPVRFSGEE